MALRSERAFEEVIEEVVVPKGRGSSSCAAAAKVTTERRFMPGYVLVRMELTDEAYHMIKSTRPA